MIANDKYLDAVWLEGGRVWPHVDCYGYALEVRRDLGKPEWPAWDGVTKLDDGLHHAAAEFAHQVERCEPEPGAVACCYTASLVTHLAVVEQIDGQLYVSECNPKSGFSRSPLRRFMRRWLRVEFYR